MHSRKRQTFNWSRTAEVDRIYSALPKSTMHPKYIEYTNTWQSKQKKYHKKLCMWRHKWP